MTAVPLLAGGLAWRPVGLLVDVAVLIAVAAAVASAHRRPMRSGAGGPR